MENIENKSIKKTRWYDELDYREIDALIYVGIRDPRTILDLRVFDLLNLFGIDMRRGLNIVYSLYKYYNQNNREDELKKSGFRPSFSYNAWYAKYKDLSAVTVKDLVMTDKINEDAVQTLYERVRKAFTDSDEYNWREYRYKNISELKSNCRTLPETESVVKSANSDVLKDAAKAI